MAVLTITQLDGEFLVREPYGDVLREQLVLIAGQNLKAGTVLGKITASGKYTILAPAASDGSQTAAAILFAETNAVADTRTTMVTKHAAVNSNLLTFPGGITAPQRVTALDNLAAVDIFVI
jgi:hypothetical protein